MRWRMAVAFFWLVASVPLWASEHQVVWGTAHESNLYEAIGGGQGGWVSRLLFSSSGYPVQKPLGRVRLQQQAGIKRFWKAERGQTESGDVLVAQVDLNGKMRLGQRWSASAGGQVKFKQATRVPGEESYLRGGLMAQISGGLNRFVSTSFTGRLGADDSRDLLLPEVRYREVSVDGRYAPNRRFSAVLRLRSRRISYDRLALARTDKDGQIRSLSVDQVDRLWTVEGDVQAYSGALFQVSYAFLHNRSNSFGYAYRAHRVRGLIVRHLGFGVDAQIFGQIQVRKYRDALVLSGRATEVDAYEQSLAMLKLSRELGATYGLSGQYAFYRNGARQSDAAYRKHVYTLSLETRF